MSAQPQTPERARELQAAEAEFAQALAEEAAGRPEAALERLARLRASLAASTPALEMQLGVVHSRLGHLAEAVEAMRRAVALAPELAAAHKNLAATLSAAGRTEEARDALRAAVAALPQEAALWLRLASLETTLGDNAAALRALAGAVQAMPTSAESWRDIGHAYAERWRYAEADRALALASTLDPGAPATESLAALVKQELGDTAGALQALGRAQAREPGDLRVVLAERLMLPQVYEDLADVARWRERYGAGLADAIAQSDRWLARPEQVFELNRHNFLLAYQGEDDTALQRGYSGILAKLLDAAAPGLRERRPARFDGSRRLRVGFVSGVLHDCTAGRYFERWITGLDPARFEALVYHTTVQDDAITRRIAASGARVATLREGAREVAARILADRLDVLVHPEVGMYPIGYLLAAMRLAPVQCAGWGHPVTTGSDAIDYYFTCETMEPADGARHYVERPVALPGLGVSYSMPAPVKAAARHQLGLPEDRRLYLCAQSLFKVHPEMDGLLADLAASDERAMLVFFQAPSRRVTDTFARRVERAFAARGVAPRGQLKFLPRLESSQFRRAVSLADVVIDTPRWSGGNTSIDAFAVAAPVVTLPGRFMRGRQTAGMLRLMGLEALVAKDPADYVRLATEVAGDPERNAALRRTIAERREVLFDRPEPLAAFSEALLRMGAGEAP